MGKEQELLEAARTGNVQVVEKLLSSRSRRSVGGSALTQLTSFLRSLNVNCADKNGYTALHHAAVNGHKDVVKLLVSEEAAADLVDNQGCTPLHLAAWRGNGEICQLLLASKTGANKVNVQNSSGDTALHMSAQYGYLAVVKVLVQHKANPSIRNLKEESPLDLAAQYGKLEVVQELLEANPDLHHKAICNHSPVHLASRNGHRDVVDCLLKNGYSVNTATDMGTGLHEAALHGKLEVVKLLLEKGVDVEAKDSNGMTVLDLISAHQSAEKSYTDIREAILDYMNKMQKQALDEPPPPPPQETLTPTKPMPKPRHSLVGSKATSPVTSPVVHTAPLLEEPSYAVVDKDRHHEEGTDRPQIKSSVSIDEPPPLPPRSLTVVVTGSTPPSSRRNDSSGSPESIAIPPPFPPTEYLKMEGKTQPILGESSSKSPEAVRRTPTTIKKPPRTKRSPHPQCASEILTPTGPIMVDSTDASKLATTPTEESKYMEIRHVDENNYMEIPNIPKTIDNHSQPQKSDWVQQGGDLVHSKKELKSLPFNFKNRALPPTPCKVEGKKENKGDNSVSTVFTEHRANEDYIDMSPVSSANSTPPVSVHSTPLPSAGDDEYGVLFQKYKKENCPKSESEGTKMGQLSKETSVESDYVFPMEKENDGCCSPGQDSLQNEVENLYETTWIVNTEGKQKREEEEDVSVKKEQDQDSLQKEVDNLYETTWDIKREEKQKQEEDEVSTLQQQVDFDDTVFESTSTSNSKAAEKPDSLPLNLARRSMKIQNIPVTPTGYHQPPTPDFPPPSPTTAIQGIQQKIQQMDEKRPDKRKSCDMTTLTDDIPRMHAATQVVSNQTPASDKQESDTKPNFTKIQMKSVPIYSDAKLETGIKIDSTQSIPGSSQNIPKSEIQSISESVQGQEKAVSSEGQEEVIMRRKSSQGSTSDVDLDIYAGLLKGSIPGGPRKVVSQIIDNVAYRHSTAAKRKSTPSTFMTFDPVMEKEEDIDPDKFLEDLDAITIAAQNSSGVKMKDDSSFEEDWDQIAAIISSYGGKLGAHDFGEEGKGSFVAYMDEILSQRGAHAMQSVGEWLESIGLEKYENFLVANGFDDTDFLGADIMEDQDLEQIGVLSYEDRRKILEMAKSSPKLTPIDFANPPSSVEEWLSSIHLLDYCDKFRSHNYDTMDKVKSILWELELRTVLDITMLGHRKRILASLGNRQPPDRQGTLRKKNLNILTEENGNAGGKDKIQEISLFKDYTKVKPHSSSEDDLKDTSPRGVLMSQSSSEEEEVFRKEGKFIRDSTIHLRPPHMAQCKSPAKTWRHKPEVLIKGCCNYTAQYLGSTLVTELIGTESTRSGISKLKKTSDVISKIPSIMLSISFKGVKFIDAKSKHVICDHEIGNIFCACQDVESLNFFAYITRDVETANHYCHVFSVKSP
ncbi:hypothetical protein ACJMK2_019484, partial [Sinanodonta woodiana]